MQHDWMSKTLPPCCARSHLRFKSSNVTNEASNTAYPGVGQQVLGEHAIYIGRTVADNSS